MDSDSVIARTEGLPATVDSLTADLRALGVQPGMTLIAHAALGRFGWVVGGPVAVILALEAALGPAGTLVMPTHTGGLSEPSYWRHPPVPEAWWPLIRAEAPAFDPDLTPTRGMGLIAETFRKQPGVRRSAHPHVSFAARGPQAAFITANHPLTPILGEESPVGRVYALDGWVLLLGVDHGNDTSLHLAEYRAAFPGKRTLRQGAPVLVDGRRAWLEFDDLDLDDADFAQIGADFAGETGLQRAVRVAQAPTLLAPQRPLVDYAARWMEAHRGRDPAP
jgi:aminoglycoside 3-N-acetyltransferase